MGTVVEEETLLGFAEDEGIEEDEFGLDADEEFSFTLDDELSELDAAEELLSVSGTDGSGASYISEEELLDSAEDAALEEFKADDELLFPVEAVSFLEELFSKLIVGIEVVFTGLVLEQPVIKIAAAEAKPAHIIFFIFNILSLSRKFQ